MTAERVLTPVDRNKLDASDDSRFYRQPRLVQHVDDPFRDRLTGLYRELLPFGGSVLDLMSAHVSHLPEDVRFGRVLGHGMNEEELKANPRLDDFFTQDLNRESDLPLADDSLDAVTIAASVQYLQYPEDVFAEVGRVLRSKGTLIVSFSNRCFPTKAIRAWRTASMDERAELVKRYLRATDRYESPSVIRERPGTDPFYAVVAQRVNER